MVIMPAEAHTLETTPCVEDPDKMHIFISKMPISATIPHGEDCNKWSNKGFGKEIMQEV